MCCSNKHKAGSIPAKLQKHSKLSHHKYWKSRHRNTIPPPHPIKTVPISAEDGLNCDDYLQLQIHSRVKCIKEHKLLKETPFPAFPVLLQVIHPPSETLQISTFLDAQNRHSRVFLFEPIVSYGSCREMVELNGFQLDSWFNHGSTTVRS